jgi:xylulokinase
MWFQAAAVLNGASALAWASRLLGQDDPAALLAAAETQYAGPGRLLFLPYLAGARTPHNDPHARGVLFGLSPEMCGPAVVQAVIEGVAYSLADALACLAKAGTPVEQASLVGGGARSAFWTRIIADTLGIPIVRHGDEQTGAAFGAARLARLSVTGEAVEAVCTRPAILDRTRPDFARHALYEIQLSRYRELYQAVHPLFQTD